MNPNMYPFPSQEFYPRRTNSYQNNLPISTKSSKEFHKNNEADNTTMTTVTSRNDIVNSSLDNLEIKEDQEDSTERINLDSNDIDHFDSKSKTSTAIEEENQYNSNCDIVLVVKIKLSESNTKELSFKRNEDTYKVIKQFCKVNNLSDTLIQSIHGKVILAYDALCELKTMSVNDTIHNMLTSAYNVYNENCKEDVLNEYVQRDENGEDMSNYTIKDY